MIRQNRRVIAPPRLVDRTGWGAEHDSWEPRRNILDTELIAEIDGWLESAPQKRYCSLWQVYKDMQVRLFEYKVFIL